MSYKSIVVNLDVDGPIESVVKVASELAAASRARLIGFCAADAYLPVTGPEGAALVAQAWQQMRDDDERRFKELREEFESLVADVVKTEWHEALDRPTPALVRMSRGADLILTQALDGAATGDTARIADPAGVVLQSGRPLLIVGTEKASVPARKAVVTWKDTKEARRALSDAVPLLQSAAEVTVVTVASTIDQPVRDSMADVDAFLTWHGIRARGEAIESIDEVGSLLDFVDAQGADLVVSGAYGHSRLREWIFGGITRSLLDRNRFSRFMSA